MAKKPKIDDPFFLDGNLHKVVEIRSEQLLFENKERKVMCNLSDVVWSDDESAFTLWGRLLSPAEKARYTSKNGRLPRAEDHIVIRKEIKEGKL